MLKVALHIVNIFGKGLNSHAWQCPHIGSEPHRQRILDNMAALQVLSGAGMYSSFVGEGEARLRAAFARARAVAPSTLFLDELDGFVGDDSVYDVPKRGRYVGAQVIELCTCHPHQRLDNIHVRAPIREDASAGRGDSALLWLPSQ